jgi:hypothetical protein
MSTERWPVGVQLKVSTHDRRPKPSIYRGVFQRLGRLRAIESSGFLERAMGIEPTSEAWEVPNISIPFTASISICPVTTLLAVGGSPVELAWMVTAVVYIGSVTET